MWAVGRQFDGSNYRNLILFNGGNGWSKIPSPNPGPPLGGGNVRLNELEAVSTSGPSDAWAVGKYTNRNLSLLPEALHWDGSSWTVKPLPTLPGAFSEQDGIVDISSTNAWMVGGWYKPSGTPTPGSFIAHWNGTAWSFVSHPAAAILLAASASGPHDIWAIGVGFGPSYPAVIEHYNGSKWTTSATLPGIRLAGVTSIGPAQAWAVGTRESDNGTVTVKWNGSTWKVVPSPNPSPYSGLSAVSAVAGGGVWAVGHYYDFSTGHGREQPMAIHWNGTKWTAVPAAGADPSTFWGVVALTPSRVVVVGWSGSGHATVARLCAFTVGDTGFVPSSASTSGPGASAYWVIPASDRRNHELADGSGFGLFDSGPKAPGSSYAFAFPASGTFLVRDRSNGATEKIGVRIRILENDAELGLQWASAAAPTGARFNVQYIPPGGTRFVYLTTTKAVSRYLQLPAGTYKFRSRLRNQATGVATGWSPTLTVRR